MDLLCIADLLDSDHIAAVSARCKTLPRVDGRASAGWAARAAKQNLQFDPAHTEVQALQLELQQRIAAHPLLRLYARPQRSTLPLLNCYGAGMHYGRHVDDALMGIRRCGPTWPIPCF